MRPGGPMGSPPSEANEKLKEPLPKSVREVPGYLRLVLRGFFSRLTYVIRKAV